MVCIFIGVPPAGRTQTERRDTTRTRVLDATIACVVEHGYADTSTRRIAERAGVTIGALQHHFAGKSELIAEAMRAISARLTAEFMADVERIDDAQGGVEAPIERIARLLDRVWEAHRSPLFVAGVELLVAARTDPALRQSVDDVAGALSIQVAEGMLEAFPGLTARPGFAEAVSIGLATFRGLALMGLADGVDADQLWAIARPQMLRTLATLLADDLLQLSLEGRPQ